MIRILYFASFREQLDRASEQMDLDDLTNVGMLVDRLRTRGGIWGRVFAADQTVMTALNQEMCEMSAPISDGDEIAFFPPVTGG